MEKGKTWTLGELAALLNGTLEGPVDLTIARPVPSGERDPHGIAFAEKEAFLAEAEAAGVGAVLLAPDMRTANIPAIRVPVPRFAFFQLLAMKQRPLPLDAEIHPTAVVSNLAHVGEGVRIGPYAVVERGAFVGVSAQLFPFTYVGENCRVGDRTILYPHVTLYQDVVLGSDCIVHSGVVLGADGFGFVWDGQQRQKVPQVGSVELGDSVEIGANTTVDRATAGSTRIGTGTKLDNLVQIGHNCQVGEHTVIAGMCGISGSTRIGDRCVLGGGVGTNDHIRIASDVTLGGRSGVDRDIEEPGAYFGTPARPAAEALRSFVVLPKLHELWSRLRKLERKVGA